MIAALAYHKLHDGQRSEFALEVAPSIGWVWRQYENRPSLGRRQRARREPALCHGMFAPDPFIFFEIGGRKIAVLSDLEIDRARKQATVDRVLSLTRYQNELQRLA